MIGASDATYHIMWIVLCNAVDDFGIREVNDVVRTGTPETMLPQHAQIEEKKRKVLNEALHGALRIAGLVSSRTLHVVVLLDGGDSFADCVCRRVYWRRMVTWSVCFRHLLIF